MQSKVGFDVNSLVMGTRKRKGGVRFVYKHLPGNPADYAFKAPIFKGAVGRIGY